MKEYKVKSEMAPHLIYVLERDEIPYQYYTPKGKNYFLFYAEANTHHFKILMEDAYCEKQRHESISNIPVYSDRTIGNREKLERLQRIYKWRGFMRLKKGENDYEGFRRIQEKVPEYFELAAWIFRT